MTLFYELIQVAIGSRESLSYVPSSDEWLRIYALSQKQALIGIAFQGLQKLYTCNPEMAGNLPVSLKLKWMACAVDIQRRNALVLGRAKEITGSFLTDGFRACILKGLSVSNYYPDPSLRQSGDIDLWVDAPRKELLKYLRSKYQVDSIVIHHADVSIFPDVETEIHYHPSYTYNPFRWRKYLAFFEQFRTECFVENGKGFCSPSIRFNSVYLLLHIFRHIYNEGVGLRQLLDYYYLLCLLGPEDRFFAMSELRGMGLERFVSAVMWVIKEVFIPNSSGVILLCNPDEKVGRFLLEEIEIAGNFGKWDRRFNYKGNHIRRALANLNRLCSFFSLSPSEVLWAPLWKLWHWCWRKVHNY